MDQKQISDAMNYQSNASGLIMFYENLLKEIMRQSTDIKFTPKISEALNFGEKVWEKRWDIEWTKQVQYNKK